MKKIENYIHAVFRLEQAVAASEETANEIAQSIQTQFMDAFRALRRFYQAEN